MINSILSDNSARAYIFGERNNLTLGNRPVAAKTGTTNDYRDAWTIGYTPSIVTGVWVGNSNNEKMKGVADGSILAAPIWNTFMFRVLGDTPIENFREPDKYLANKDVLDGIIPSESIKVDISTGQIATAITPPELISEISVERHRSILFYIDKENPLGPQPEKPENDPQFLTWEKSVSAWAEKNASSSVELLKNFEEINNPENIPTLQISKPLDGVEIKNNLIEIEFDAQSKRGINSVSYFINGNLWKIDDGEKRYLLDNLPPLLNGYHSLLIRVCDDVNNCSEKEVNFNLKLSQENVKAKPEIIISYPTNIIYLFPLQIFPSLFVSQLQTQVELARLLFFIESKGGDEANIIANVSDYKDDSYEIYLKKPNNTDVYRIYYEARNWSGDIIIGEKIEIDFK
jgi:membrane carboxypeptidase/penicillin-binding protein PbpC